jgi:hypothetical protein
LYYQCEAMSPNILHLGGSADSRFCCNCRVKIVAISTINTPLIAIFEYKDIIEESATASLSHLMREHYTVTESQTPRPAIYPGKFVPSTAENAIDLSVNAVVEPYLLCSRCEPILLWIQEMRNLQEYPRKVEK